MLVAVVVGLGAACGPQATQPQRARGATDDTRPAPDAVGRSELLDRCRDLMQSGQTLEARALLEPAVRQDPDWPGAKLYLAMTYSKERRWETARRLYEEVLQLEPGLHAVHIPYAWCLYYLGQLVASRDSFEAYLEIEPDYADAVFGLALIDFDNDDMASARRRLLQVIELAKAADDAARQSVARVRLADVHVRSGELEQAKSELSIALRLDPSNPKVYFKLSHVLRLLGDADGAGKIEARHAEIVRMRSGAGE